HRPIATKDLSVTISGASSSLYRRTPSLRTLSAGFCGASRAQQRRASTGCAARELCPVIRRATSNPDAGFIGATWKGTCFRDPLDGPIGSVTALNPVMIHAVTRICLIVSALASCWYLRAPRIQITIEGVVISNYHTGGSEKAVIAYAYGRTPELKMRLDA